MVDWVPKKNISCKEVEKMLEKSLETGHLTNYGPNVQLLEEEIRNRFDVEDEKAVVVVNNGSTAIQVLAASIEYKCNKKLKWATQAFTFPPSAQSNLQETEIVDIDLHGGLDLEQVDETIDGIIITNIFGNVVDIKKYEEWAKDNNKYLIFDNAATSYTYYNGKNCINYGLGSSISFHHTKPFGFGEGGAIIINKEYEKEVRCLINFGIGLTDEYFVQEGTNGKMSDISAVYILQYWDNKFEIIVKKHRMLYQYLKDEINGRELSHFKLFPSFHDEGKNVPACFSFIFDDYKDEYKRKILDSSIFCRKYYHPLKELPNSKSIYDHILCIPCNIDMEKKDIDNILDKLQL
jgi:dTDP-4-amino-4,6-dideoxygalactose transaminase